MNEREWIKRLDNLSKVVKAIWALILGAFLVGTWTYKLQRDIWDHEQRSNKMDEKLTTALDHIDGRSGHETRIQKLEWSAALLSEKADKIDKKQDEILNEFRGKHTSK